MCVIFELGLNSLKEHTQISQTEGREGQLIRSSYYNYKSLPLTGLEKRNKKTENL